MKMIDPDTAIYLQLSWWLSNFMASKQVGSDQFTRPKRCFDLPKHRLYYNFFGTARQIFEHGKGEFRHGTFILDLFPCRAKNLKGRTVYTIVVACRKKSVAVRKNLPCRKKL